MTAAVKATSPDSIVRDVLTQHGPIYFQDMNIKTPQEFSQLTSPFGWTAYEDIGNTVRRTVYAYNVPTANDGPNTQSVYPHIEFSLSPHYPAYMFFCCMSEPESGAHLRG